VLKHTAYNAAGLLIPMLAALAATPLLIHNLGTDRFGLLTLIWAVVSYFGIFDLGLGRALTLQVSVLLAERRQERIGSLVRTSLLILLVLGLISAAVLLAVSTLLVRHLEGEIEAGELFGAVIAMAVALPFIILTSGARGALEAKNAFGILNMIRIPMGLLNFGGPVLIALYGSGRLDDISWLLAVARIGGFALHLYFMWRVLPETGGDWAVERSWVPVLAFNGGWITVSNIVGPLMGYLDRFIVGLLLVASAVAYYAAPQELALRGYVISGAFTTVLFPRFAAEFVHGKIGTLYWKATAAVCGVMVVCCGVGALFAYEILSLWISSDFAANAHRVMQILMLGLLAGSVSSIPYTYLQAVGGAHIAALSHVAQVPFFLVTSYLLTSHWGIEGAAVAWSIRLVVDAVVLFVAVEIFTPARPPQVAGGQ